MTYYNVEKVLEIIKGYKRNINMLGEMRKEFSSVGVAQYGIEASLPKGNKITNVVEKEVLRQLESSSYFFKIKSDIKYLQDRWDRITDEKHAQVLALRLDGFPSREIADITEQSERNVNRLLREIAKIISYQQ